MRPLLLGLCLLALPAAAATIFQTGFESPAYTTGQLSGQDGWTGTTSTTVQTAVFNSGAQAAQLNAAGLSQTLAYHSAPYTAPGNPDSLVTISTRFFLDATAANNIWTVIGYGTTADFIGQLVVENSGTLSIGNTGGFIQGPKITKGVWNTYTAVLDYNTQTTAGYLNGVLFASIGFNAVATDLTYILAGLNNATSLSTGSGYWDDLTVTTSAAATGVPEPGSILLVAAGAALIALRRR